MGFKLVETMPTNATVEYWNIHDINICRKDSTMHIELFGYKTEDDYRDGAQQITRASERLVFDEPFTVPEDSNLTKEIYLLLSETEKWVDAESVI
jgi:hypothetical protein